jgi:hypothetical protein
MTVGCLPRLTGRLDRRGHRGADWHRCPAVKRECPAPRHNAGHHEDAHSCLTASRAHTVFSSLWPRVANCRCFRRSEAKLRARIGQFGCHTGMRPSLWVARALCDPAGGGRRTHGRCSVARPNQSAPGGCYHTHGQQPVPDRTSRHRLRDRRPPRHFGLFRLPCTALLDGTGHPRQSLSRLLDNHHETQQPSRGALSSANRRMAAKLAPLLAAPWNPPSCIFTGGHRGKAAIHGKDGVASSILAGGSKRH